MAVLRRDLTTQTSWPDGTTGRRLRIQKGWRQTWPITKQDLAMSYSLTDRNCIAVKTITAGNGAYKSYSNRIPALAYNAWINEGLKSKTIALRNKAVSRFQEQLGENASLGAALATVPESFRMIATRTAAIVGVYRNLRKGRFKKALASMNVRPLPKHKNMRMSRPKDASALWLEYWFGWAPMIGDIYSACEVVCQEFPPVKVRGTASCPVQEYYKFSRWGGQAEDWVFGKTVALAQADVQVTNPNLFLLSQLGLLNPASIAWELVPFSFMVDWFGNIGDVINDWTAYAGLSLTNSFTTVALKGVIQRDESYVSSGKPEAYESTHKFYRVERTLEVPKHRLHFQIPGAPSATRAATAVSLATLIFGKG